MDAPGKEGLARLATGAAFEDAGELIDEFVR